MKSGNLRIGYVFMSTSAQSMGAYVGDNLQVFVLSALGVLTLTFIVLYALTYRMVRPLRQMAAATRAFGEGDFSVRVPVEGKDEVAELAAAASTAWRYLSPRWRGCAAASWPTCPTNSKPP